MTPALSNHDSGDCWPDNCPVCANTCDACGEWLTGCVCPTLPLEPPEEYGMCTGCEECA